MALRESCSWSWHSVLAWRETLICPVDRGNSLTSMKKNLQWLWSSGGFTFIRIGGAAAAFLGHAWLSRHYPNSEYGVYAFCWSMLLLAVPVVERGIGSAALKFVPIFQETENIEDLSGFFHWAHTMLVRTGVLVTAPAVSLLCIFAWLVPGNPYGLPLAVTFLGLPLFALAMYYMYVSTCFNATTSAFVTYQFGLPILLVLGSMGLDWIWVSDSALALCSLLVAALAIIWLAERLFIGRRFVYPLLHKQRGVGADSYREQKREWRQVASTLFKTRVFELLHVHAGTTVAGLMATPETVSAIFIANRIADLLTTVGIGISFIVAPNLARLTVGDPRKLKREYRLALLVLTGASLLCALGLGLFREWVLGLFGSEYVAASRLLMVFILGTFLSVISMPGQYLLVATGYHRKSFLSVAISGVLYVALLFAFTNSYGAIGVAAAFVIGAAVRTTMILFFVEWNFKFLESSKS